MTINDAAFRKVIRRKFDVDSVTGQNSDPVTAHAPCNMRENNVAVVKLYGKCRARIDLFDATGNLDRALFDIVRIVSFRLRPSDFSNSATSGY